MTAIAVSGAAGFLGSHLCPELTAHGHRVHALSRAELNSQELVAKLNGIETFVHLAARAHVLNETSQDPRAEFRRDNLTLTQQVALAARRAGVKRFVFVSSAGVLGATSPPDGFREDSLPHPHDAYTESKLQAEEWLNRELAPVMELVIVRPPLIYGPNSKGNLMRLLRLALKGWPLPIGALLAPRSLVGVRNIVDLLRRLATHDGALRGTMLVADRERISVAELFRSAAHYAGHRPWLAPLPPALVKVMLSLSGRGRDVARLTGPFVLRPQLAAALISWNPPHSQQAELQHTVLGELAASGSSPRLIS